MRLLARADVTHEVGDKLDALAAHRAEIRRALAENRRLKAFSAILQTELRIANERVAAQQGRLR